LLRSLNRQLGAWGVGRHVYTGDVTIGLKGRIAFECPGIDALLTAHQALEDTVNTRFQNQFRQQISDRWAELVYTGFFYEPHKIDLEAYLRSSQAFVSGEVVLHTAGGSLTAVAVDSAYRVHKPRRRVRAERRLDARGGRRFHQAAGPEHDAGRQGAERVRMSAAEILGHLQALVACDTQNPPRAIDGDSDIFGLLPRGSAVRIRNPHLGSRRRPCFVARRSRAAQSAVQRAPGHGAAGEGWSSDPLRLQVASGRAFGRGACDIKGAAAVLLALAEQGAGHLALLFTSDEEGADGCCVARFLEAGEGARFEQVVVAEPTSCRAVLGHRGYLSVKTASTGSPGTPPRPARCRTTPITRWPAGRRGRWNWRRQGNARPRTPAPASISGLVQGGSKSNVIAGSAFVHWSARLRPGESSEDFLQAVRACAEPGDSVGWEVPFQGEPLPAAGRDDAAARAFCDARSLPAGDPVDFWTEAALFSAAGLPALVLGPGDIEQAHAIDEWVGVEQLEAAFEVYGRIVSGDG
jgi:acetylornithine deacetylase